MAKKNETPNAGDVVSLGPFAVPSQDIAVLAAQGFSKSGVVVANDRIQVTIPTPRVLPSGESIVLPAKYNLSVYISREALTEYESGEVTKMADANKAKRDEQAQAEAAKADKIARLNFELGQNGMLTALKNVSTLQQTVQALSQAIK